MTVAGKRTDESDVRSCCPDANPCTDPEKCLLRKQRSAFLESLLVISPLSKGDMSFLSTYFDQGPGGSGRIDLRDFAIMFGSDESRSVFRVATLLRRLKESTQLLGYKKSDLY